MVTRTEAKDFDILVLRLQQEGFTKHHALCDTLSSCSIIQWVGDQPVCSAVKAAIARGIPSREGMVDLPLNAWETAMLIREIKAKTPLDP